MTLFLRYGPFFLLLLAARLASAQPEGPGTPLLTDAALSGWSVLVEDQGAVPNGEQRYFVWEDSLLHVLPDAAAGSEQPFAALVTDSSYSHYRLTLEYRWGEKKFAPRTRAKRDAGVLFHVHDTIFWPTSLEFQIQEGDTGDIWLVGTRATSTRTADGKRFLDGGRTMVRTGERYVRFTHAGTYERPGWNQLELVVRADSASFRVNGHLVNALSRAEYPTGDGGAWQPLAAGRIALQAEGAEVFYRRVRLQRLPEATAP